MNEDPAAIRTARASSAGPGGTLRR